MRKSWLLCVLLGTMAWGQAAPEATPPPSAAQAPSAPVDKSASLPPDTVVLTITGVCPATPKTAAGAKSAAAAKTATAKTPAADCKTEITKAEFEKTAGAVAPNVTPQLKKQLAAALPRLIALSTEAKKEGVDKTPQFAETMKFVKMQVLSQEMQKKVQKQAADIPPADVEKYYKDHPEVFQQITVDRLFVPRTKQSEPDSKEEEKDEKMTDDQQKAKDAAEKMKTDEGEAAMTKVADELHARAAKGEEIAKLQKEAYDAAGMKVEAPSVTLTNLRRTGLPPGHAAVFNLKVGDVSDVISDSGGHYVYKVVSQSTMTMDQATNEIHSKMQNDRMREMMDKLNGSFKAIPNEAYFGPGGLAPMPPPRIARPRPGMPPAGAAQPQTPPPSPAPEVKPN
jgi:hypothetical protein